MTNQDQNEAIAKWMGRTVPCHGDQHHWKRLKMAESIARLDPNAWIEECTNCRAVRTHETRHPSQYYWDEEHRLPDYVNDLNAMHEAIQSLKSDGSFARFVGMLENITNVRHGDGVVETFVIVNATAGQRAEALLKTLSLWKEQ